MTMSIITKRKVKELIFAGALLLALLYFGAFTHIFEEDYKTFHYPYDGDIEEIVQELRNNQTPQVAPINSYAYRYERDCAEKCENVGALRLVFLVKSAPGHLERRIAIRSSWGFQRRFSDVEIRTVFLLGETEDLSFGKMLEEESRRFNDLVRGNFTDSYFNNTLKTMMGFHWALHFCPKSRFYMFVDDDYYVSTKNLLRFVRNPVNYPRYLQRLPRQFDLDLDETARLYGGYVVRSAPHRHWSSKWYVSLEEYPYHMWPPYVTAGALVLSREALKDMYFASFYTKHFRFDDIFVAILALKAKVEPFHCDRFYFDRLRYDPRGYEFVVASHGFGGPKELLAVWNEQRSLGHA